VLGGFGFTAGSAGFVGVSDAMRPALLIAPLPAAAVAVAVGLVEAVGGAALVPAASAVGIPGAGVPAGSFWQPTATSKHEANVAD
jgi:hypothetical protein